jgi:hypothetical protein
MHDTGKAYTHYRTASQMSSIQETQLVIITSPAFGFHVDLVTSPRLLATSVTNVALEYLLRTCFFFGRIQLESRASLKKREPRVLR